MAKIRQIVRDKPCVKTGSYYEPMGGLSNGPIPDPYPPNRWSQSPPTKLQPSGKSYALRVNRELIRTYGRATECAHPLPPRTPNGGVANRRLQIEHIMCGRRAARSPLW